MFNIYATDYAPIDPIIPPCDITPIFIGYKGENKARCLIFDLTDCVETFGDGGFVISFIRQGDDLPYLVTDTDRLDNNAIWIITDTDTAVDGYGMVQMQYIVDDVVCKSALYRTVTFDSNSITGDVPDPYEDLLAQIAAYAAQAEGAATTATAAAQTATTAVEEGIKTERSQRIAADEGLNTRINELMGLAGAPSMANSAAAMTDSSKVYVYTGSEAGYLTGHWYYYNGTEWADGGVYQATAVNTDKTLTVEGMAADAAACGDLKRQMYASFVTETITDSAIASFTDGADDVSVKDLVVNITPKQAGSGDPSPSNVRAISGWTGANIYSRGKNLFYYEHASGTANGITFTVNSDKTITMNGTATGTATFLVTMSAETARQYAGCILSGNSNGNVQMLLEQVNAPYTRYATDNGSGATILDTIGTNGSVNFILRTFSGTTLNNVVIKPMIRAASDTDNTYEPYNADSTVYNVSFGSAGTVHGGTLDVTSGMLTVTHGIFQMNSSAWGMLSGTTNKTFFKTISGMANGLTQGECYCNKYRYDGIHSIYAVPNLALSRENNSGTVVLVADNNYTSAADFNASLTDADVIVYPLAQPVSVQLTATDMRSLLGNNNIWSDTGSVASCEYRADTKLYLEKLTNPDNDMTADSNIASGQYFMVNNTLYLATAAIASGATIVPGTNCTETSLAAALNAINA